MDTFHPVMSELAAKDAENAAQHDVDLNPYSTSGMRHLWQTGYDGKPLPQPNAEGSANWRAWERGRQAKLAQIDAAMLKAREA